MQVLQSVLAEFENVIYKQKHHFSLAIYKRKFHLDSNRAIACPYCTIQAFPFYFNTRFTDFLLTHLSKAFKQCLKILLELDLKAYLQHPYLIIE